MLPSSEKVVGYIPRPSSTIDWAWKPNIELAPNCPRCDSSNTKFCYYNNYSLTQPRYFCKGCRRYWTKGGSLRNVPVGGGCRKSRPRSRIVRPVTNSTTSNLTQLQTNSIRPDVILNDPSLNGGDGSFGSSSDGSAAIDLAVLYAKFSNQNEPGFQSTGLVTVPNDLTVEDVDFSGTMSSDYQPDLVGIVDCQNGNNIPCLDPTMEMQFCSGFLGLSELDNHFDLIKTGAGNSCGSQLLSVDESVASGDLFWSNYSPTMTEFDLPTATPTATSSTSTAAAAATIIAKPVRFRFTMHGRTLLLCSTPIGLVIRSILRVSTLDLES